MLVRASSGSGGGGGSVEDITNAKCLGSTNAGPCVYTDIPATTNAVYILLYANYVKGNTYNLTNPTGQNAMYEQTLVIVDGSGNCKCTPNISGYGVATASISGTTLTVTMPSGIGVQPGTGLFRLA